MNGPVNVPGVSYPEFKKLRKDFNEHGHTADEVGAQKKHIAISVTLSASRWSNGAQTVAVNGISTNNTLIVASDPANYEAYVDSGVYCAAQAAGTVTFQCKAVPSDDLKANIMILDQGGNKSDF